MNKLSLEAAAGVYSGTAHDAKPTLYISNVTRLSRKEQNGSATMCGMALQNSRKNPSWYLH